MKPFLKNAALFLVSCLIALAGIEVALRILGPDVLAMGNQYVFYQFSPKRGWDGLPNASGRFSRSEFSHQVTNNARGMRDAPVKPKRDDEFRVAVLGDSFTWGLGARYGERFTEIVENRDETFNVLNFGVSGYSPVQYWLQLDDVLALKPDFVVLALCLGNDLTDNVTYSPYNRPKPYVTLSTDGEGFDIKGYPLPKTLRSGSYLIGASSTLRTVGMVKLLVDRWQRPTTEDETSVRNRLVYVKPDVLEPDKAVLVRELFKLNSLLLSAIKTKIDRTLGPGRFAVLLVPTKFEMGEIRKPEETDPNRPGNIISADLARLGIPVIDGRDVIIASDFWKHDGHWRPGGHAKIGEQLAEFLKAVRNGAKAAQPSPSDRS